MRYFRGFILIAIIAVPLSFTGVSCSGSSGGGKSPALVAPDFTDVGNSCTTDEDCSAVCYMPAAVTDSGYCTVSCLPDDETSCPDTYLCEEEATYGYICLDNVSLANGVACATNNDCASSICAALTDGTMVCSECITAADCPGAEDTCELDEAGGYFTCTSPDLLTLGQSCSSDDDCNSSICADAGGDIGTICSGCEFDSDCGQEQVCVIASAAGYADCSGTLDLGDSCTSDEQCISGECRGEVCSECTNDSDCSDGGFCVDSIDDVGYFVCEGELGDYCEANDDCGTDYCFINRNVCSECSVNADCGVSQECDYDGGDGYASCVGTATLGDSCDSDQQCISESCNTGVCSECNSDSDCNGGTCTDDRSGTGYFVCEGELGEDCNNDDDCGLGYCYPAQDVCSECANDEDCGVLMDCVYDNGDGYASCTGIGELGETCDIDNQCISGYCTGGVCSDCGGNGDCDGGSCIEGNDGYYFCTTPLSEPCSTGEECDSGYCYDRPGPQGSICSTCEVNEDCGDNQECAYDGGLGYAICSGTGVLGADCADGSECESGICNSDICSECFDSADCNGDGECIDDRSNSGYFLCTDDLGAVCESSVECISGYCYESGTIWGTMCSECETADDCLPTQECNYSLLDGYALCAGTESLGAGCDNDYECASGFCSGGFCSECGVDADCASDACYDDTAGVGYFVCLADYGELCTDGSDCGSGECYPTGLPNLSVCSECESTADCATNQTCTYDITIGYAECRGTDALGELCLTNEQCDSGYCNSLVCSECLVSDDCDGGICADNRLTAGYFVCEGNFGELCDTGEDCGSGECFQTAIPGILVCSECEADQDCNGGESCTYDLSVLYATCSE